MEEQKKTTEIVEKKGFIKEAMANFDDLQSEIQLKNIVKDNKIEFKVGDKTFRVKKPNLNEQDEVADIQRKKYTELISDDSFLFRKQWIKKYKVKGVDIEKMESDMNVIQSEVKKTLLRLATVTDKKVVNDLKAEVKNQRNKMYELSIEITDLLSYCIETQVKIYADAYTACVILEVKNGKNWERYFKSYEEFQKSPEVEIINKTFYYFQYLMYSGE